MMWKSATETEMSQALCTLGQSRPRAPRGTRCLVEHQEETTQRLAELLAVAEVYLGVPLRAQLAQNCPNPFNSDTVIEYPLPQPGEMQLEVYDLAGQRVTTLASGSRAAGSYSVAWDGSGDDSQPVASGVYLYRLQTKVGLETRKLILLR